jgi:hypothetical protein
MKLFGGQRVPIVDYHLMMFRAGDGRRMAWETSQWFTSLAEAMDCAAFLAGEPHVREP